MDYNNINIGRFMTPDWSAAPSAIPYASLANPQSLNLYSYVLNNPMTGIDSNGHCCLPDEDLLYNAMVWWNTLTPETQARIKQGAEGTANVAAGMVEGAGAIATSATSETGVGALGTAYLGIHATGSIVGGTAQIAGAISGKSDLTKAGTAVAAASTISGAATLAATGSVDKASKAAALEGVATMSGSELSQGGPAVRAIKVIHSAETINKAASVITPKPQSPPPPSPCQISGGTSACHM